MIESIPPELETLMEAERAAADSTTARRERVLRRLSSSVAALAVVGGVGGAAASIGTAPGTVASRTLRAILRGKIATALVAASLGAAGGGAVGYRAGTRHVDGPSPAPRETAAPHAALSDPIPSASAVLRDPSALPDAPNESAAVATTTAVPTPGPTSARTNDVERDALLAEELALIQTARTALVRGDPANALEATNVHRRRFPKGRLAEERESVAIQALARLGAGDEARRRAADFEGKYPTSVFLPAVERALRSIP